MAEKIFLLHILFLLAFSFHLHSAFCRTISLPESENSQSPTTLFDVSASIQRTLVVLSLDPPTLKPTPQYQKEDGEEEEEEEERKPISPLSSSSSSSFSLSLHPRSSLHKTHHPDYKSLTLSRLHRDSARVKSIASKIELAVNGVNASELRPVQTTNLEPEGFETPVTSGLSQGSGEYFSRVGVGRPATPYYVAIDTGSDISWLQCEPCSDCYQQSDPIFDPSGSSTYRAVSCDSPQCNALQISACRVGSCLYQVSYGDGSFTVGDLATETLSFGNSGSVDNVAIGCGHDNEGLFVGAAGLLGLGGGTLSLPSQLKASSISYCLVDRDSSGSSTLEFDTARPGDSVTAPLLRNSQTLTYRYVGLTGLGVGGVPLDIPASVFEVDESGGGGVIVDSGTAVTRLKTQAYNSLRDAFVSQTRNLPSAGGVSIFDTCYDLSSMKSVSVPTVSFQFAGGKALTLPAKNYLVPVDSNGTICLAFAPTGGSTPSIIGSIQQQGTRVSYDLANSLVGFSPNKC